MIEATPFPDEARRLSSLHALHLLDTPIEERFERITRMVCRLLDVPIAIFNLLDEDRQHYKSVQGLAVTDAGREAAFCTHVLHEKDMMLVPDTHADARFHDNPFVTGEYLDIGFYAGCPVRAPDGMPVGTLCAIDRKPRDLTEEQQMALRDLAAMVETEIRVASLSRTQDSLRAELDNANKLALVDPLTRLWNRGGIYNLLEREWSEAQRQQTPITLVMADIDHFKKINDTRGHAMGDAVLRSIAKRLLSGLRDEDAVGRVGGEEFLIILTGASPDKAMETVERLRESIASTPLETEEGPYAITMSFGLVSTHPQEGKKAEDLVKRADEALYCAKGNGRNRVELAA